MLLGTATATDLFAVTITNNAPVTFPVGITTVTWTATDANGNASTATQLVTISLIDTLPPVITVPANVYTSTSTSQATVNIGTASANDNIDGIVAITNNAPATFPVGVTSIIYTASDNAGNTATATQQIYVSFSSTVGGGTTTPPPTGGGATVGMEAIYWHHNDHLGTPQAMTDINGTKVWEMSQTPFGIATVNEDPDGDGLLVVNNFRFPGQYYDAETGHHYNYHRTYIPEGGNYSQSDPIGLKGGLNTFGYVGGNPINAIDPNGLTEWKGIISGLSGGVGIAAGGFVIRLTSDCVNNEQAKVVVLAGGAGAGFSFSAVKTPSTGSASSLLLDDRLQTLDPNALEGFFMAYVVGATAGTYDGSLSFVNVGRARNKKFLGAGMSTDVLSIGFSVIVGPSIILSSEITSCDCGRR